MAKLKLPAGGEQSAAYAQKTDHPLKEVIDALRQIILTADSSIGEQVKWNAPCFFYTGEMKPFDPKEYKRDIVVFNLHKKDYVLLVFPTGAKVDDQSGLLEGSYTDGRRTLKIRDMNDVKSKAQALQTVIKEWLKVVDK